MAPAKSRKTSRVKRGETTQIKREQTPREASSKRRTAPKRGGPDLTEFRLWLETVDEVIKPAIHINGQHYTNCVMTVDFGQPLRPVKLNNEQTTELVTRMRAITSEIVGITKDSGNKEKAIRISSDSQTGVWWSSVG